MSPEQFTSSPAADTFLTVIAHVTETVTEVEPTVLILRFETGGGLNEP